MKTPARDQIQRAASRLQTVESLRRSLDRTYVRIRTIARQHWEEHFGRKFDPADACVTVRVAQRQAPGAAIPASGFLIASSPSAQMAKKFSWPRYAH